MESSSERKAGVAEAAYLQVVKVANLAVPVVRFAKRVAAVFALAGLCIWALWLSPSRVAVVPLVGSLIAMVVLVLPGVIYALFGRALEELVGVPRMLRERAAEGGRHVATITAAIRNDGEVEASPVGRGAAALFRLARALYDMGRLGTETKGTLLGIAGIVRLGNPVTLIVLLVAGVSGATLTLLAFVGLVVALF